MDRIAVYVILCSTLVVSEFTQNGRFKRDSMDLDALTDEEIFALLEKSEDYAFETESPDSFILDIGDYDEHGTSTVKVVTKSSSQSTESTVSKEIPELTTLAILNDIKAVLTTKPVITSDITTEGYSKSTDKTVNLTTINNKHLTNDSKLLTTGPGAIQTTAIPSSVNFTTPLATANPMRNSVSENTMISSTSSSITSTTTAKTEVSSPKPITVKRLPESTKYNQITTSRTESQENGVGSNHVATIIKPSTIFTTTEKSSDGTTETSEKATVPSTTQKSEMMKYTNKSSHGSTTTGKPSPSSTLMSSTTETRSKSTLDPRIPSTTTKTPTTTTKKHTTTTKKHTTTTKTPTTTTKKHTTTTKKHTTTTKKHTTTTQKPTTTTKKHSTTTKKHSTTTKKPTTTTSKKHTTTTKKPTTPTSILTKINTRILTTAPPTSTSIPATLAPKTPAKPVTKRPTTARKTPTTTRKTPTTKRRPFPTTEKSQTPARDIPITPKPPVLNKPFPLEQKCFNLINPDNTTSNQCFFFQGIYPEHGSNGGAITTTPSPTTSMTTPLTSTLPTTQNGGSGGSPICFALLNDTSKCFFLNLDPSEPPITEKIATLAPHRVFEITEAPAVPLERVSLKPTLLNHTMQKTNLSAVTSVLLSKDRLYVIPPNVDLGAKRNKNQSGRGSPASKANVPILQRPWVIENTLNKVDRFWLTTTPKPRWVPIAPSLPQSSFKGGSFVRFGPRKTVYQSSETVPGQQSEYFNPILRRKPGSPNGVLYIENSGVSQTQERPDNSNYPERQFIQYPWRRIGAPASESRMREGHHEQHFSLISSDNRETPRFILVAQPSYNHGSINNVRARPDIQQVPTGQSQPPDQPVVSNVRIRIPNEGTFSQTAFVSSHDPHRSVYERIYLDVARERTPPGGSTSESRQNHQRLKRAAKSNIPIEETEGITLGFVVDTTASMGTELNEVKKYALIIMNEVLNNRGSHIENFVFVPIHDEDPVHERLWLLTRNRDDMSRTISQIRVAGGGTCPENSLIGLLKAIELAEKDSHIFVFTDAFAQDYHLVPDVIKSIQRKKPRIYFLLTGECKKAFNDDQRYAFDRIATASTGIVARLNKDSSQLRTVLEAVELEFEKNRRIVTEAEGEPTGSKPKDIKIQVDPKLTNLSVTSTGRNTKIDVVGPRGRPRDIVKVLDMPNIQIVFVPKPDPGEWTVSVTSPESPFKIVASGISTTDFLYGFSVTQTNQTSHLSKHPKQGVPNYVLLVAKDPSVLYNISSVQLVSGSTIFDDIEVTVVNYEQGIYRTGPLVFPDTSFKMRINAYTLDGYPLTRLTKATIVPQEPGPPEIDCKRSMVATAGLPFNMTCSIESLIPMVIQMYKEGNPLSHPLQYSQSSTVILQFTRLEAKDGGNYIVDARNAAGSAIQYVNLIVKEEPPSLELEPNFITAPGKRQVMTCQVSSLTEYSLVWMKSDSPPDNFYLYGLYDLQSNSDNMRIEGSQVVIDPVRPEDEGWYVCSARNGGGEGQARSYLFIREPPIISIDNANDDGVIQFTKDTRVMLSCRIVKGIPTAVLGWYDTFGKPIQNGVNKKLVRQELNLLQLILHGATESDEGTYICSGENLAGRDSKKVKLQYVEKPVVIARENRVELLAGERLSLECSGTGIPEPNVTWSRITAYDTTPVPIFSSRKDLPGRYLELQEVTTHDSGTYICRAINDWGSHEDKILVAVGQKPHIFGLAKTHSADINQVAEIRCTASGVPAPAINWRKSDGTPTRGIVRNGILTIEYAKLEDAGLYVCTSQNKFGRAEAATVLSIRGEPPKVMCSPDSYQFVLGELAEIRCNVTGTPSAEIKWFRNGRELDSTSNDGRLQFRALNETAGRFEIFAMNEAGNASATVNIFIYEQPSFPRDAPTSMDTIVGSNVSLPCETTGNPPPEVTWDILNFPVIPNKLVFNPASGSLEIFNVDVEDEGTYTCRAKNKAGQRAHTITLEVFSPPQAKLVSWDLHEGSIRERKELALVCHVKGKPEPQITWTKDGLPLANSLNFTINRNKLKFFTAVSSSGLYACHAKNKAGEETRSIYVNVTAAPSIENPEDQLISGLEGDEIILNCVVHGNPAPEVTWYKRDEELQAFPEFIISDGNLIIPTLSIEMEGAFSCIARNFLGHAEKVFRVTVNSVPQIESEVPTDIEIYQFDDYAIPCKASGKPNPSIHWNIGTGPNSLLQNSDKFKVHQDGTLLLYNVQVEDVGSVTCYAQNSVGLDRKTHQIRVVVPSSLTTHLQKLLAENTSATVKDVPEAGTMRLECPAPKGKVVEWLKDDQPLKIAAPERADDPHYNVKADSRILLINDAVDTDIGKYTCVYPPGVRHDFYVNVLAKPYFYSHDGLLPPEVYQLQDGQSVVVNCSARGNPEPTVSWQRLEPTGGWIPFTNYTMKGVQFVGRRNEILSIPEVRWAHNGTYKCTARSRLGKHSRTFALSWSGPPQVIGGRIVELIIPVGKPASLICSIEGSLQLEFVWEFLSQGKTYHLSNPERNLTLQNVNTESAGTYKCKATNAAGTAEQAFVLQVVVPPILSRASVTSLTYRPYEDIELKCTSRGLNQDEEIIWMKGDFLLSSSDRVSFSTSKFSNGKSYYLKIINAQEDDTDTYRCVLFNIAGKAQQLFEINVLNRP